MHPFWRDNKPQDLHGVTATATGKRAVMRIYDPIDSDGAPWGVSAKDFAAALDALPTDVDSIELHIHSPGGSAFDGIAILNALRQHPATVNVVVDGLAASAASYIAMAGDTIAMAPNSEMMIHDPSALAIGQAVDMREAADMLDKLGESMSEIYAERAGGSPADWRAAMQPGTWYKAQDAVDAGLADRVLPKPVAEDAPTARFDLSVYADVRREPFIPAATATPQTPAEPPEQPPTPEEADTMSDTITQGLRERLGVAADADEATILAALDEALAEQADPPAASTDPVIPDGKVLVSQNLFDELKAGAAAGAAARAKQLADERDEAVQAAVTAGKISAERREHWAKAWDADPEGTKADLESLPARFPVGAQKGHQGDGDTASAEVMTDAEAESLAAAFGVPKEALING